VFGRSVKRREDAKGGREKYIKTQGEEVIKEEGE
jgi:hypothetical protein